MKEGPLMPLSSELNQLIAAHNLLGNAKYSLLEELDNVSFANDEVKAFVLALADYTHDPRAVNLLSNLFDEGIDKWTIGTPCPNRFIGKFNANPSITFEVRPINGTAPVELILNVGLTDYTPNANTTVDELEYVVIPADD
jgi:hypothetical protein